MSRYVIIDVDVVRDALLHHTNPWDGRPPARLDGPYIESIISKGSVHLKWIDLHACDLSDDDIVWARVWHEGRWAYAGRQRLGNLFRLVDFNRDAYYQVYPYVDTNPPEWPIK